MVRASASQREVEECFCVLKAFTQLQSALLPPFHPPGPLQKSPERLWVFRWQLCPALLGALLLPQDLLCTQELGLMEDGVAPGLLAVALGLSCAVCEGRRFSYPRDAM